MARLFTTGFECGDLLELDGGYGTAVASATEKHTGSYSHRCGGFQTKVNVTPSPNNELYIRAWAYPTVTANAANFITVVLSDANTAGLYWNSVGQIELRRHGTAIATLPYSMSINVWRMWELYAKIAESPDGILTCKIDGVQVLTITGDTRHGSVADIVSVGLGWGTNYCYFDDVAINDTSGAADNSWCGDGRVIALKPNAAGDVGNFTPSAGANYQCVDEVPPNSTDYNYSPTDGHYDLFNLEACGLSGVDVLGVDVKWTALKEVANGDQQRAKIKTGGTEYNGDDQTFGTSYTRLVETWRTNPNTSAAWTTSELDSLQAGYENRAAP